MAGIDFDRQAFVTPADQPQRPAPRIAGFLVLLVVLGAVGFVGYKIYSTSALTGGSENANLAQIQDQLNQIEKRLDQLEKHRKVGVAEPAPPPLKDDAKPSSSVTPHSFSKLERLML